MKKLMIFLIIVTTTASAGTVSLQKGALAPFTGSLSDPITMSKIRVELIEKDALEVDNTSLKRSIHLYELKEQLSEDQINQLSTNSEKLAARLKKSNSMSTWERIFWFGSGVVVTGLAISAAGSIVK